MLRTQQMKFIFLLEVLFAAENPPYGSLLCFYVLWFSCSRLQPSCLAETGISPLTTNNVRENEVLQCSKLTQAVPDGFYSPVWPMSVCLCECMCALKKIKPKSSSCWLLDHLVAVQSSIMSFTFLPFKQVCF